MKTRGSSIVISLLAAGFAALNQTAPAQEVGHGFIISGPGGRGGIAYGGGPRGPGQPGGHFNIFIAGPDAFGARLLKACDTNQDGGATPDEITATLATWFQRTDTDTNSVLDMVELSTSLKELIPPPQPPPGAPAPPEQFAPHNLLARHAMARADANQDGLLTLEEAGAYLASNFTQWDADSSGALIAKEFEVAFAQLMAPDASERVLFEEALPPGGTTLRVR